MSQQPLSQVALNRLIAEGLDMGLNGQQVREGVNKGMRTIREIFVHFHPDTGRPSGGGGGVSDLGKQSDEQLAMQRSLEESFKPPAGGDASLAAAMEASIASANKESSKADVGGDPNKRRREPGLPVGLKNTGNLCYFNSLVQAYFFLRPTLTEAVLTAHLPPPPPSPPKPATAAQQKDAKDGKGGGAADPKVADTKAADAKAPANPEKEKADAAVEFVRQLQRTFAFLQFSARKWYDPTPCVQALFAFAGRTSKQQQDVHEYNIIIQEAIELGLATAEAWHTATTATTGSASASPRSAAASSAVQSLFGGRAVEELEVVTGEQRTLASQDTAARTIELDVDGGDLHSAMEQYVSAPIEGYREGSTAHKQVWFKQFPDVLCFLLQRAGYDKAKKEAYKRNDRFAFDKVWVGDRYLLPNKSESVRLRASLKQHRDAKKCVDTALAGFTNFCGVSLEQALTASAQYYDQTLGDAKHPDASSAERKTVLASLRAQAAAVTNQMATLRTEQSQWQKQIDTNFESLDARPLVPAAATASGSGDPSQARYQLFAVLIHDGRTAGSGHYWCYVKRVEDGRWLSLNDMNTSFVDEQKVMTESLGGVAGKNASAYFLVYINASKTTNAAGLSAVGGDYARRIESLISSELRATVEADNTAFTIECDEYDRKQNDETIKTESQKIFDEFEKKVKEYATAATKPAPSPFAKGDAPAASASASASGSNAAVPSARCHDYRLKSLAVFIQKLKRKEHSLLANAQIYNEALATQCSVWDLHLRDRIQLKVKEKLLGAQRATMANVILKGGDAPGSVSMGLSLEQTYENELLQALYNSFLAVTEPFLHGLQTLLTAGGGAGRHSVTTGVNLGDGAARAFEYFVVALYRHASVWEKRASRRIEIGAYLRLCALVMMREARRLLVGSAAPPTAAQVASINRWMTLITGHGLFFCTQLAPQSAAKSVGFYVALRNQWMEISEQSRFEDVIASHMEGFMNAEPNPNLPLPAAAADKFPVNAQALFERHSTLTTDVQRLFHAEFAELRKMLNAAEEEKDDDAMVGADFQYPKEAVTAAAAAAAESKAREAKASLPPSTPSVPRTTSGTPATPAPAAAAPTPAAKPASATAPAASAPPPSTAASVAASTAPPAAQLAAPAATAAPTAAATAAPAPAAAVSNPSPYPAPNAPGPTAAAIASASAQTAPPVGSSASMSAAVTAAVTSPHGAEAPSWGGQAGNSWSWGTEQPPQP